MLNVEYLTSNQFLIAELHVYSVYYKSTLAQVFQSKDLRHPNVTKLRLFLCTLLVMTSISVMA